MTSAARFRGVQQLLVITRPDAVDRVHRSFFEVGCDVVETDTFGGSPRSWPSTGWATRYRSSTWPPPWLARTQRLLDHPGARGGWRQYRPRYQVPDLGQIRYAELRDAYEEQASALLEGGVDLQLIETVFDLLQAKAADQRCPAGHDASGGPYPSR